MKKTFTLFLMIFLSRILVVTAQDVAGGNIILNSSFDTNDAGWGNYFDYSWAPNDPLAAKGNISVVTRTGYAGNACKVTITNAGSQNYSVQLSYPLALEAGKRYSMKFKASADANRSVSIHLQSSNTTWYSSGTISITTTPTVYGPYYYTATTTDQSNFFKFYLGGGGTSNGISAYFDDVEVAEMVPASSTVPGAPTNVTAVGGSNKAIVSFTAPTNTGGLNIRSYTVTSNPGSVKATGTKSPIQVRGLTEGTAYTFTVIATNGRGNGVASATSNSVTPSFKPITYYVSPGSGSDNNNGTSVSSSWATLDKAHAEMDPGDTVLLRTGTYPPFAIKKSGAPSRTITYKAFPGDKPVMTCGASGAWDILDIFGSYITVDGIEIKGINDQFTLQQAEANYDRMVALLDAGKAADYGSTLNTNTNGISINEKDKGYPVSTHVTIKNCRVHGCAGAGIGAVNADYLLIENNDVFDNVWYSMWACSGITVIHLTGTDAGSNTTIRGNRVYNNYCAVKWIETRDYSDGNGIIVDVQYKTDKFPAYSGKILIENNLVYDNGGRGLYVMAAQNVTFRNNTSYWNSKSWFISGGEMVVHDSKDITFVNNIAWANPAYPGSYAIRDDGAWGTNANIIWKNNIAFNGTVGQPSTFFAKTTTTSVDNTNRLGVNPLLVNPTIVTANANFSLQSSSPAINAGTSTLGLSYYDIAYGPRVQGASVDIGAYEFQGTPSTGGTGLTARYYNNINFTGSIVTRVDPMVNFSWGQNVSPASGIDGSTYSIMWDGYVKPQYSGTYTFYTRADDGIRLWVNGQLLIDNYVDQGATEKSGTISLTAGESYIIQIQYYNNTYDGVAQLSWSHAQQAKQVIPQGALFPAGQGFGLSATYYDNMDFTGTTVSRIDPTVNFNWGSGSPSTSIGVDTYSVRWRGQVKANNSETYTFYTNSDDGVRLWVNGVQLINNWTNHAPTENSGTISLIAGQKYNIVMEYYENGVGAVAQLSWSSPSQAKQIIPSANLYPSAGPQLRESTDELVEAEAGLSQVISAYPNPAKDLLNVTFNAEREGDTTIELTTTMLQVVSKKSQRTVKGNNTVMLDVRALDAGLYLLNIRHGSHKAVKKIIIAK